VPDRHIGQRRQHSSVEESTGVELVIHDSEADPQVIGSVPIEGPETVQDRARERPCLEVRQRLHVSVDHAPDPVMIFVGVLSMPLIRRYAA